MYELSAVDSLKEFQQRFRYMAEDQLPFATALTLTWTAQDVKSGQIDEMKRVFDSPTRFTLNSVFVRPATKQRQVSTVWLRDYIPKGTAAADYLAPHIFGGKRGAKRFEKALIRRNLLPQGMVAVPGQAARLNQSGNVSKGQITKMLSNIGGQHDSGQNTTSAKRSYWLRRDESGRPEAIWFRKSRAKAAPFMIFARSANYDVEYDFFGVGDRVAGQHYVENWLKAMDRAVSTSR